MRFNHWRYRVISIICTLFILICMIVCFFSMKAHADEYVTGGYGSSTITYSQPSDYCIIIPETIDADAGAYVFQAGQLNITENERVYIILTTADQDNNITLTHESGTYTLDKQIVTENVSGHSIPDGLPQNCVGYFEPDSFSSALSFALSEENYNYECAPKAGRYSALVEFSIYLSENG